MIDIYDVLALVGLALLTAGGWLVWPPAGLLVPGAGLLIIGVIGAGRSNPAPARKEKR